MSPVHEILDSARWAPSADNTQPWRFEILSNTEFVVHGRDTRESCVYDLDGRISCLALGALLETIEIAATTKGLDCVVTPSELHDLRFHERLLADQSVRPSRLAPFIKSRSVQRRMLNTRQLPPDRQEGP